MKSETNTKYRTVSVMNKDRGRLISAIPQVWPGTSAMPEMMRCIASYLIETGIQQLSGASVDFSVNMSRAGKCPASTCTPYA